MYHAIIVLTTEIDNLKGQMYVPTRDPGGKKSTYVSPYTVKKKICM